MLPLDRISRALCLLGVATLAAAHPGWSQERVVVSNQVEVSRDDASLLIEFSDGDALRISFEDGVASVDGEPLGSYEVGGEADRAWRRLLADVLSLSNGPLARALERWEPEAGLPEADRDLLRELDRTLDRAMEDAALAGRRGDDRAVATRDLGELLQSLARSEHIGALAEALEDADIGSLDIHLDEDREIRRGATVEGGLLMVDGDLEVAGRVAGDVIVMNGSLTLAESGEIEGDVRLIDSELERDGGEIRGDVVDVLRDIRRREARIRDEIRADVRREVRESSEGRRSRRGGPFYATVRAVGGVFETLFTFLILGFLTVVLTRFGGDRVDSVTQAVADNPARSAAVGFAGGFLILPVYILGIVVLVISIVGIPALLVWGPIFPLAVAVGGFMGYLGVSHHVGRWVLDQEIPWLDWADRHSSTHLKLVGVGTLLAPFAAASVIRVIPLVGWLGSIVEVLGTLACLAAMVMGFGAVILTRGGKYANYEFDLDIDVDSDWSSTTKDMGTVEVEEVVVETEAEDGGGGSDEAGESPGERSES